MNNKQHADLAYLIKLLHLQLDKHFSRIYNGFHVRNNSQQQGLSLDTTFEVAALWFFLLLCSLWVKMHNIFNCWLMSCIILKSCLLLKPLSAWLVCINWVWLLDLFWCGNTKLNCLPLPLMQQVNHMWNLVFLLKVMELKLESS